MTEQGVAEQIELAGALVSELQDDGFEITTADLLDHLALAGLKLSRPVEEDFDHKGQSVVSLAYFEHLREVAAG
jgi:hypothetical protein